jgi:aminoglycoside phosphotransferase (APT) family kinase protein
MRALPGGHSGLTWLAELESDPPRTVVVKSTPPGRRPVGRHDVLRQARVLRALSARGEVAVPAVYFSDDSEPPFFAMERIEGEGAEPVLAEEAPVPEPTEIASLWEELINTLVLLHRPDPAELGLSDGEPVLAPADELERWAATMVAGGLEHDLRASRLVEGLRRSVPDPARSALLHGDYRLGNTLYARAQIRAVIDWEIWSIGDARCDVGWLALFADHNNFPNLGRAVAGTPDADHVIGRYAELHGDRLDQIEWFRALACFKLGVIQAHNLKRHLEGRRADAYLERFRPSIERLLDAGLERLESS